MIDRTLHRYLSNFLSLSIMQDPLQRNIEKLKIMKESAKRRNEMYTDISKLDDKNTTRSLKALTKAPAPGNKISKYLNTFHYASWLIPSLFSIFQYASAVDPS